MKKLNTKHVTLYSKAIQYFLKAKTSLRETLKELLLQKGFSEEVIKYFDIRFTEDGVLTLITFNGEGEYSSLGYENCVVMSKQEIIDALSVYLSPKNVELIKS